MTEYKLVPVEPTGMMQAAALKSELHANTHYGESAAFMDVWRAMLAAAPEPEQQVERDQDASRESRMVVIERDESGAPTVWCDPGIADLVAALNEAGIRTVASCSGHGHRPGNIVLVDGRELIIARNFAESRLIDTIFSGINGEPPSAKVVPIADSKPQQQVEQEPVSWQFFQDGRWWNGDDRIRGHRKNTEQAGFPVRDLYATPPAAPDVRCEGCGYMTRHREHMGCVRAAKQSQTDVSALVEALEFCFEALEPYGDIKPRDWKTDRARLATALHLVIAALSAHREQQS